MEMPGVAAVARRLDPVGQHHRERAEHAVGHPEPGEAARRARGRQDAVADRARRADHLDRAEHALVVRDALREHRAHAGVGGGLGERERVVDRALHLRMGAGPVDHHVAAALAQGDEEADRLAVVDAVVVDPVLEAPFAVRQLLERGARQALGIVDRLLHVDAGLLGAVLAHELGELPLGDVAGRELRAQVAEHLHREADVLLDEAHQRLVDLARLVELERRDAQALGVDLGGIGRVRPGDPPADVGVVAHRAGEREPLALVIERLEDEDVGQVHAAVERVVHDEDVARRHVVAVVAHDRFHRRGHRTEVPGEREALCHELALGVGEAGRVVHVVLQHARVGRAEDRERHLVGDREHGVLEELEGDRIVVGRHCVETPARAASI